MHYTFVIVDKYEGKLTFNISADDKELAYDELDMTAAENNCDNWEIWEEYEEIK